jgi:cell division transport system permease protein
LAHTILIAFIFREAFRAIRRTPGTWAMNVLALAVALGLSGLFGILAWNAHSAMQSLRANLAIEAFFDPSIPSEAASRLVEDSIKHLPLVQSVAFTSREQALSDYTKMSGEDVQSVLGMNPLPASVRIRLINPTAESVAALGERLRAISGVAEVRSDLPLIRTMEQRGRALDTIALIAGSLLLLSAILFTILTARFIIRTREDVIHTMTLLGASKSMIYAPLVIESALGGVVGGLLAMGILMLLQHQAFSAMGADMQFGASTSEQILLADVLVLAGVSLGILGSFVGSLSRRSER